MERRKEKEKPPVSALFRFFFSCFPAAPPNTLNFNGAHRKRKTLVAPEINISLDQSEGSLLSDDFLDTPDDLDINVDDIETPDETDSLEFLGNGNELEWEGEPQPGSQAPGGAWRSRDFPATCWNHPDIPRAPGAAPQGSARPCGSVHIFFVNL